MTAKHVRITGQVQGVFFRAWTREQARELGLTGWVRNCSDGSVEAHLEGDEDALLQMIERLHQGPSAARVEDVRTESAEPRNLGGFEVKN